MDLVEKKGENVKSISTLKATIINKFTFLLVLSFYIKMKFNVYEEYYKIVPYFKEFHSSSISLVLLCYSIISNNDLGLDNTLHVPHLIYLMYLFSYG